MKLKDWLVRTTYGSVCSEREVDFCVMGNVDCMFFKNVNVVTEELQHSLVVVDLDRK